MNDTQLFLIHGDDYLSHISDKAAIYALLLAMGRETREKLCDGDVKGAVRQLSRYEQEARRAFAEWNIPESYLQSGDERELCALIEDELLPADEDELLPADEDEGCCHASERCCDYAERVECGGAADGDVGWGYKTVDAMLEMANALLASASEINRIGSRLIDGANTMMDDLADCRREDDCGE